MTECSCYSGHALLCSVHDEEALELMGRLNEMMSGPAATPTEEAP